MEIKLEKKIEITEAEYTDRALEQIQECLDMHQNLCGIINDLYRKKARGDYIKYYKTESGFYYEVKDKRRAGF